MNLPQATSNGINVLIDEGHLTTRNNSTCQTLDRKTYRERGSEKREKITEILVTLYFDSAL